MYPMLEGCGVCAGSLTFINCWKVELAAKVQNIFTVAKLFALGIVILIGVYQLCKGKAIDD